MLRAMSQHFDKNGQEVLYRFTHYYEQLNVCILNGDRSGVADILTEFAQITHALHAFRQDEVFNRACNEDADNLNDMMMLQQALSQETSDNSALLQSLNAYLKPMANRVYHVSQTYKCRASQKFNITNAQCSVFDVFFYSREN